jgi:integrase
VPLTPDILAIVDALPRFKKGKFLFSTTAGQSPTWIGTKIKERLDRRMLLTLRALAKRRGEDATDVRLPHFMNHDIRRTVRSQLSRLKVPEEAREAVLAHVRPDIKGTYDLYDYRLFRDSDIIDISPAAQLRGGIKISSQTRDDG